MKREMGFRIALIVMFLMPIVCASQTRKAPQRTTPDRGRPPFLQQAKSYETTSSVTRLELRNGLTVLVEELRSQQVVSLQTYISAGSFQEPANAVGSARLLAARVQNWRPDVTGGNLAQSVRALGGIPGRFVDYEHTRFEINVPSSQWKQALSLQADAILKTAMESKDLAVEADLILGEARNALDNAGEFSREAILEMAFGDPRFEKSGELIRNDLRSLNPQSLLDFYKAMYVAPKITLVISGDISSSEILNEIVRLYGKLASPAAKANPARAREAQNSFRYRLLRGNVGVPRIVFGFHAVPETAEDFRALEVLSAILGTGDGSILSTRLKYQMGLIDSAESGLLSDRNFGYFLIELDTDVENIDRSEIAALTEIELLKRKEPEKAEVLRAQSQLELDYWKSRETATGRAGMLARYEFLGNWKRFSSYVSEIRKVSPADIRRVAGKYLRLDRCSLLEYLPADTGMVRNTTVEGVRQTLEGLLESSANLEQARREKEVIPFMKIPETPDRFSFSEIQYPFQVASILRGPEMFIREDHTSPLIEMGLFFRGGRPLETNENAGITWLMTRLMLRGTKEMPAAQFQRQLEIYGARIQPVVEADYFGLRFSVLSRNFPAAFELLQEAVRLPVFDKDAVDRQKKIQMRQLSARRCSLESALDRMNQALFPNFYYSGTGLGSDPSIAAATEAALLQWHGEYVKNRKPYVVIIGDTKGTSLAAHFVKHFSGSRIQEVKIPDQWAMPLEKPEAVEQSWNRAESLILFGFQAAPIDDEDASIVRVLENLIANQDQPEGEAGERLRASDRLFVSYDARLRGGSFIAGAFANPEDENRVLAGLKGEIMTAVAGPNTYREVRAAVNSSVGAFRIRNQERFEQIRQITMNLLAGQGLSGFINLQSDLQSVKAEDLTDVMPGILDMQKAVILRVHGASK